MRVYSRLIMVSLVGCILVPQLVFAAWWNPFSWFSWSSWFQWETPPAISETATTTTPDTSATDTANTLLLQIQQPKPQSAPNPVTKPQPKVETPPVPTPTTTAAPVVSPQVQTVDQSAQQQQYLQEQKTEETNTLINQYNSQLASFEQQITNIKIKYANDSAALAQTGSDLYFKEGQEQKLTDAANAQIANIQQQEQQLYGEYEAKLNSL